MDPYLELEISIDASEEEIKAQYRALAMIHHPDKGGDEEKFKRIKEAYEILSDPIRRKGYDMSGDAESNLQLRNSALDHIAQMVNQIVPDFDSEQGDLIGSMHIEVTKIRQSMFENINICNKYLENLNKVIVRINAKHNKQNILLELVQKQIDQRKREHEDFTKRIQICDLEIEILKDYEYGLIERIAISNTPSE
jgi:curved DNA-binding protein CbpA